MSAEATLLDIIGSLFGNYCFIVLGIIISFILPILRKALPQTQNTTFRTRAGDAAKQYYVIVVFSLVAGFLTLAALPEVFEWKTALLTGYAWDSTLQKLTSK